MLPSNVPFKQLPQFQEVGQLMVIDFYFAWLFSLYDFFKHIGILALCFYSQKFDYSCTVFNFVTYPKIEESVVIRFQSKELFLPFRGGYLDFNLFSFVVYTSSYAKLQRCTLSRIYRIFEFCLNI